MLEVNSLNSESLTSVRSRLERFERSQILEVYFARADGRIPVNVTDDNRDLYDIDLALIKSFLLGQHPQDPILHKLFNIMN